MRRACDKEEVEIKPRSYPRDWFVTEADQRRIVRELHGRGVGGGADKS